MDFWRPLTMNVFAVTRLLPSQTYNIITIPLQHYCNNAAMLLSTSVVHVPAFNNELCDAAAMPQLRTKCGERAFSHAGPAVWNALPEDMRAVSDSVVFRNPLKTHFLVLLLTFVDYCCILLMTCNAPMFCM